MQFKNIEVTLNDRRKYGLITICREKVSNALDEETTQDIMDALDKLKREDIRAVIITGKGNKSFSAGADLYKLQQKTSYDILESRLQNLCLIIENYPFPIIAAVNGYAFGGGMELALSCDFRIASENAKFALPEVSLGIIPSAGGTQRLSHMVGTVRTKQIIMLGQRINAAQAKEWGLISEVVEQSQLLEATENMVDKLLKKSPYGLMLAKSCINLYAVSNIANIRYEKMCQAMLVNQNDKEEGISAFYGKRLPSYEKMK